MITPLPRPARINKRIILTGLLVCLLVPGFAQPNLVVQPFLSGFNRPVRVVHAGDDRLFVAEIGGKIKVVKNGTVLSTPFLDIDNKIDDPEWGGIFSIVFHPDYAVNGYVYVMYIIKGTPQIRIARFTRAGGPDSDVADPTETPILTIPCN